MRNALIALALAIIAGCTSRAEIAPTGIIAITSYGAIVPADSVDRIETATISDAAEEWLGGARGDAPAVVIVPRRSATGWINLYLSETDDYRCVRRLPELAVWVRSAR